MPEPPIFVISLARAKDRRAAIQSRLDSLGLRYEIFDAVDGEQVSQKDKWRFVRDDDLVLHRGVRLNDGEIGCALSHYKVWQTIAVGRIPAALVLEDDVVPPPDLESIVRDVLQCKTKWDIVILHAKKPYRHSVLEDLGGGRNLVRFNRKVAGSVAYLITAAAAEKLVAYCCEFRAPIDYMYAEWWRNGLEFLGVLPAPIRHHRKGIPSLIQIGKKRKLPRTIFQHIAAAWWRFGDWRLRRRMIAQKKKDFRDEQRTVRR
ncbi:MAG: glycosyltransferase family 25 protein [Gammaproteobacteria bacterium]